MSEIETRQSEFVCFEVIHVWVEPELTSTTSVQMQLNFADCHSLASWGKSYAKIELVKTEFAWIVCSYGYEVTAAAPLHPLSCVPCQWNRMWSGRVLPEVCCLVDTFLYQHCSTWQWTCRVALTCVLKAMKTAPISLSGACELVITGYLWKAGVQMVERVTSRSVFTSSWFVVLLCFK